MKVSERFLKYVGFDTQSDPHSDTAPSSMKQKKLGAFLVEELKSFGLSAEMDEFGIVYSEIPANVENEVSIGLIAHMDTSPDCSGENIKPRIVRFDGQDIVLNEEKQIVMGLKEFPNLKRYIGDDLIVTDGETLLGADDKAGIAIIMNTVEYLMSHPQVPHGRIGIAFTPDEEVGRGSEHFDVASFNCDFAYTIDGGEIDYIDYENFNAASADVLIHGKSIHPGSAKNKMINAIHVAYEFHACLDPFENPAYTEGYEGFNHLCSIQGECECCKLEYIIRNHDQQLLEKQKQEFILARDFLNKKYGYEIVELNIQDSYANMRTLIEKDMRCVDRAAMAMKKLGIDARHSAIRGGTDGASLTYQGLYTPNLGTGGENYHGRYECVSIQAMEKMVEIVCEIVKSGN